MSESNSTEMVAKDQNKSGSEASPVKMVALRLTESIGIFHDLVAAGTPTPGGGSVAALSGLMAASLGQMVCNITIGKPKYAAAEPRLKIIRDELEGLGARLRELIAEDAESFDATMKAYRLPKESDEQKQRRAAQIESALLGAIKVPLETAARSFEVLNHLRELADIGNPNALSDAAVGAQLASAAIKGASYNVRINIGSLSDKSAAEQASDQTARLIEQSQAIAEEIGARI
jgi:formiminotetrahydrofolate cyclodeaminase